MAESCGLDPHTKYYSVPTVFQTVPSTWMVNSPIFTPAGRYTGSYA
jgi:hypothetical protein